MGENGQDKKMLCFGLLWFGFFQDGMPAPFFV